LRKVYERLLLQKNKVGTSRGPTTELTGVLLHLTNPRARLSRTEVRGKLFSAMGELLWYFARSNSLKFIEYYVSAYRDESDDGKTIYGAYGPRLFNMRGINQIDSVLTLLRASPDTRRAVIQLINAEDLFGTRRIEIPCTCTLQFLIRKGRLHMLTSMRSNDAFLGLPHDVFAFTMLQEYMARSLSLEPGDYKHIAGSLHLYADHVEGARQFLREGWQEERSMPAMPSMNLDRSVKQLLKAESAFRNGRSLDVDTLGLDEYWADLARLLQIYGMSKKGDKAGIQTIRSQMSDSLYNIYIDGRNRKIKAPKVISPQMSILPS
jgi:thymidylate synthase